MGIRLSSLTETQRKRSQVQRVTIVYAALLVGVLLIVARLIELQVIESAEYRKQVRHGQDRHISARRGEVFALNQKNREPVILATNTTLDLVYVDPALVDDAASVADTLAGTLVTAEFHDACRRGTDECPRELVSYFKPAFDPLASINRFSTGTLLEPVPYQTGLPLPSDAPLPDLTETRRLFARDIQRRISQKSVQEVPLLGSATKVQLREVEALHIPGILVDLDSQSVWANPSQVDQRNLRTVAAALAPILRDDPYRLADLLRARELRYVPVMRRLPVELSLRLKELKLSSAREAQRKRSPTTGELGPDPFRCIALIPEHWRFYPDGTIASQVVGFINAKQEAQYGIERAYDLQLRGQDGIISMVSDRQGGQIVTAEQTIVDPRDGDKVYLTVDPFVQKEIERILADRTKRYQADSGQVIVMDPYTGRIIAMANAPLFERNSYSDVYRKEAILLPVDKEAQIVAEIYHPETNVRLLKAYRDDVFDPAKRALLPEKVRESLDEAEQLYDLQDLARYFLYAGEHTRIEVFPTSVKGVWLKYRNNIGVGAYLNRTIQEIYEPGSVMKPITMAIAIDQGELVPDDTYDDVGPVKKDEKNIIKNALLTYYGKVTMTDCLAFSINTCMTAVSDRLGKKLFHRMLERFGFGRITSIELEDEQQGFLLPWKSWSDTDLATIAFGQGVSTTPLHMIAASAALANGGKLMRPYIIDRVEHADGTVEVHEPKIIDQVITGRTSETITAMLVSSVEHGYAKTAKVRGYRIAGKTGTSQIAGPGGKYEAGTGSTIASFMGYAPADRPRFIALVKFDRPKDKEVSHGAATAAPAFHEIAEFLFKYYGIPPDEQ